MVDNSNMPHPKCLGSQKNPCTEPKTCEKGPKLGFEYLPTSKTLHCERTACALRAWHSLKTSCDCLCKIGELEHPGWFWTCSITQEPDGQVSTTNGAGRGEAGRRLHTCHQNRPVLCIVVVFFHRGQNSGFTCTWIGGVMPLAHGERQCPIFTATQGYNQPPARGQ